MPRLDPKRTPVSTGIHARARRRAGRPRCRACGLELHELVAPTGYHVLCSPLPTRAYDSLMLPLEEYLQRRAAVELEVVR